MHGHGALVKKNMDGHTLFVVLRWFSILFEGLNGCMNDGSWVTGHGSRVTAGAWERLCSRGG